MYRAGTYGSAESLSGSMINGADQQPQSLRRQPPILSRSVIQIHRSFSLMHSASFHRLVVQVPPSFSAFDTTGTSTWINHNPLSTRCSNGICRGNGSMAIRVEHGSLRTIIRLARRKICQRLYYYQLIRTRIKRLEWPFLFLIQCFILRNGRQLRVVLRRADLRLDVSITPTRCAALFDAIPLARANRTGVKRDSRRELKCVEMLKRCWAQCPSLSNHLSVSKCGFATQESTSRCIRLVVLPIFEFE